MNAMPGQDKRVMVTVLATCGALLFGLFVVAALALRDTVVPWIDALAEATPASTVASTLAQRPPPRVVPPPDRAMASAGLRGNPAQFFDAGSYPPDAVRAHEEGRTVARLTVDRTGVPIGCVIVTSSGSRSLDAATCSIAIGKVRFDPARDPEGRAIASTYRLPVRWVLPRS